METTMAVLHIVTAVFIVGPMAVLPMSGMRAIRSGEPGQVAVLARSTFIFSLASLIVVVFGFGVLGMSTYGTKVTTPWVLISLILYVIALAVSLLVVVPAMRSAALVPAGDRAAAAPAGDGVAAAPAPGGVYQRVAMGSGLVALLMVVVVVLMVAKP